MEAVNQGHLFALLTDFMWFNNRTAYVRKVLAKICRLNAQILIFTIKLIYFGRLCIYNF
jgi:hypothetical protein